jgi:hypothetical protein
MTRVGLEVRVQQRLGAASGHRTHCSRREEHQRRPNLADGSRGEREDSSGPLIQEMVKNLPAEVVHYEIIPDEKEKIVEALKKSADV